MGVAAVFCANDKDVGQYYGWARYWLSIFKNRAGEWEGGALIPEIASGDPPAYFKVALSTGIGWMNEEVNPPFTLPTPPRAGGGE